MDGREEIGALPSLAPFGQHRREVSGGAQLGRERVLLPGNLGFSVDDFFGGLVRRIERRP